MVAARTLDIAVRFERTMVLLHDHAIEIRERGDGVPGALLHRYAMGEAAVVELFVGPRAPRKVLRLCRAEAIDLGAAANPADGLWEAREIGLLVDRPVVIRELDHELVYFADHTPRLFAYEAPVEAARAATVLIHRAYAPTVAVGFEDPTEPG